MTSTTISTKVSWTAGNSGPLENLFADAIIGSGNGTRYGTLTTDHAAASYGQPVVVGEDGSVYGPGDLPQIRTPLMRAAGWDAEHLANLPQDTQAEVALIHAARAAGWNVSE